MEKQNRVMLGITILSATVFIFLFGGRLPFALFFTALLTPTISFLYLMLVYFNFKYAIKIDDKTVIKGGIVDFEVDIQNESMFLFPYMSVNLLCSGALFSQDPTPRHFSLPPKSHKAFVYRVECRYRGVYELGVRHVNMWDLLCVFKLRYRPKETSRIVVYPRIVPVERFYISACPCEDEETDSLNSRAIEGNVMTDIRDYNYGDPLNKVHWKLTARRGDIQVKNYKSPVLNDALMIVDTKRLSLPDQRCVEAEDKLMEAAASVAYYCLSNGMPVRLLAHQVAARSGSDSALLQAQYSDVSQFPELHRQFALLEFSDQASLDTIFTNDLNRSSKKTNMIVFSYNVNEELYSKLVSAKNAGFTVTLIALDVRRTASVDIAVDAIADTHAAMDSSPIVTSLRENDVLVYNFGIYDDLSVALDLQL